MSSTFDRALRGVVALAVALAAACGDDDAPVEPQKPSVARALTQGVRFDNGKVELGKIPPASNERVQLQSASGTVQMEPSQSSLMQLAVDNGDDRQVDSVLLQFGDDESHVAVDETVEPGDEPVTVSLGFTVDEAICEGLCAAVLQVELLPAVRLEGGEVARGEPFTVTLDCREHGDPDAEDCPEPPSDAAVADASDAAAEPVDSGLADLDTLAAQLSEALGDAHDAFCTNCSDPERIPCYAVAPTNAIACINNAIRDETGDVALRERLAQLVDDVTTAQPECEACDLDACSPALLTDALPDLPDALGTAIEACVER